jgi:putative DNA primase/helicase
MDNSLHDEALDLQAEELITNTQERIEEIHAYIEKDSVPENFQLDEEGVWYLEKGKNDSLNPIRLSSPLRITGYTRDHQNQNHGRVLEFKDIDEYKHSWTMPMELLAGESAKIIGALLNMGLQILPGHKTKERLLEYITLCEPSRRARCVLQTGWFGKAFVLPSEVIGAIEGEKIIYQNTSPFEVTKSSSGSLEGWRLKIAQKACGNSRLLLALSASFSGSMLHWMNHENIGIHYRGPSSKGKSTAEYVANSVWGCKKNVHTFRATANGLEGLASHYNDRLLCLDELGQLLPHDAGQVFYMLGNGIGKGRATQQGSAKKQATWRLVFLSNGELSLEQLLNEGGKKVKAGQEVRLIDIPADTGIYGLFENLHEFADGTAFSDYLKDACVEFYGTASEVFLRRLVEDIEGAVDYTNLVMNGIKQRYLPKQASSQVVRVFNHFALIAAVGELASHYGITGWKTEEALRGVMKCFQDWLSARGSVGMHEEQEALEQVRNFFEQHGESRFTVWDNDPADESQTRNRVGFRRATPEKEVEFYVFLRSFRKEICKGLDPKVVEEVCIKHGFLMVGPGNCPTRSERLPGNKKTGRCYRFTPKVLVEEGEE